MFLDLYTFPRRSANVDAPSFLPILLVLVPNMMNATISPRAMFRKHNHIMVAPWTAACPPNPMTAEALRNVAPYERAMITGFVLFLPSRYSLLFLVFL